MDNELINIMKILNYVLENEDTSTPYEIKEARRIATKLYLAYNNNKIKLSDKEFHVLLSIFELQKSKSRYLT